MSKWFFKVLELGMNDIENTKKRPEKIPHIAVMRLSAMGDVAMLVPVLLAVVQQYPNVTLTVVSRPLFAPFFKDIPNVVFFPVDLKSKHKGLFGLYKLYKELAALGITAFADSHNVMRSKVVGLFFKISGISVCTLDKGRAEKKELTALKTKTIKPLKSMFERHAQVFSDLGFPVSLTKVSLLKPKQLSSSIQLISGEKHTKWIGIAPFAQYETKIYPIALTKQVIQQLSEKNIKIFLFGGGKKEVEILDNIASEIPNCINVAGLFSLEEEMQLISQLDAMLSMDSGNGHIAAMLGVKVLTLWGNTHPFAGFVPFNQPITNSITPDLKQFPLLPTSVYGNKKIEGYTDCMRTILPENVVEKLLNLSLIKSPI